MGHTIVIIIMIGQLNFLLHDRYNVVKHKNNRVWSGINTRGGATTPEIGQCHKYGAKILSLILDYSCTSIFKLVEPNSTHMQYHASQL